MSKKSNLDSNRKKILTPEDVGWHFKEISRNVHVIEINFDEKYTEQKILLQSDVHWDNPKTKRKLLLKHLNQAKEFNAPIIDAGDWFCAMQGKYDPRSVKSDIRPEHNNAQYLDSLVETSAEFLEPYKHLLTVRGQGNHECVDDQTEVLTRNGFMFAKDIDLQTEVAQLHPATSEIIFTKPLKTHSYDYNGKLLKFNRRGMDMLITPNHRVVFYSQKTKKLKWEYASDLGKTKGQTLHIPTCGVELLTEDLAISDDELKLAAWAITDGGLSDNTLTIYQSKPTTVTRIRELLKTLKLEFSESKKNREIKEINGVALKTKPLDQYVFRLKKACWNKLKLGITSKTKLPDWVWKLSERQFDVFIEELILGDGSRHKNSVSSMMLYGTKELLDSVQAIAVCRGYRAMLSLRKRTQNQQNDYWCLNIVKRGQISLRTTTSEEVDYNGKVYCLTTPSANFVARRNGKVFVTGNSSILKRHETNLTERLVERLRANGSIAKLGGYSGWVRFLLRRTHGNSSQDSFRLWYHHGWGGGGPVTRGTIQTNRIGAYIDSDITLTGHCFDTATEILTPTGWKSYDSLVIGSEVMTLNRDTGYLEPNAVSAIHVYHDYKELVHIQHKSTSLMVTDKHGLWLGKPCRDVNTKKRKPWKDCAWTALPAEDAAGSEWWIRNAGIEKNKGLDLNDDQIALLAWIIAEGHCDERNGQIRITQGDGLDGRLEILERNLKGAVKEFSKAPHKGGKNTKLSCYRYTIKNNPNEWGWIKHYIDREKNILPALLGMSEWQRKIFLDTYIMADGSVDKTKNSTGFQIASNRQDHIDFLQALCVRTGLRSTVSYSKLDNMIYLHACEREASYIQPKAWSTKPYEGTVWCVTVPNSTLVVRRDGKTSITMNTHDSWIMPLERLKLNNNNKIVKYRQVHVRTPGYKEEYDDGFGGWHIERGGPPKALGAAWLTIKTHYSRSGNFFSFDIVEAK